MSQESSMRQESRSPEKPASFGPDELVTAARIAVELTSTSFADAKTLCSGFELYFGDKYGWSDNDPESGVPFIMWEEGPYEWVYQVSESSALKNYLDRFGMYASPVCGWGLLAFYEK